MPKTIKHLTKKEVKLITDIFNAAKLRAQAYHLKLRVNQIEHNEKIRQQAWAVIRKVFPDLPEEDAELEFNDVTGTIEQHEKPN